MKNLIVFFAAVLMLTGCDLQQNPLKNAPKEVQEGRMPDTGKVEIPEAFPKEALQIDAPNVINGRVGSPLEFKIGHRVMVEGVQAELQIDNLSEFVDAEFDVATGTFTWTPTREAVGNFGSVELPLNITLLTIPSDAYPKVSVERKKVMIVVMNAYTRPIIESLTGPAQVAVGSRYTYKLVLEDLDAYTRHDVSIFNRSCATFRTDLSYLVSFGTPVVDLNNPGKFLVDVTLDLGSMNARELPTNTYCFGIAAVSKYGQVSQIYKQDITLTGTYKATRISTTTLDVEVGKQVDFAFSVYDPTGNGNVTINSISDLGAMLPGSEIVCKAPINDDSFQNCTGKIDASSVTQENVYSLEIQTTVDGRGTSRTPLSSKHIVKIHVNAGGN